MPKRRRYIRPGTVYHFISRFVAREWFIKDEHDRAQYLRLLGMGLAVSDWSCLAYAVMSNHIHLALVSGEMPLRDWIAEPHSIFAQWMNERHERVGAVFVRGPKMLSVRHDIVGVGRLLSYIHRNPVRAGLVARASDSPWTSHRAYLGAAHTPPWLDVSRGLQLTGFDDRDAFGRYVDEVEVGQADLEQVLLEPSLGLQPTAAPGSCRGYEPVGDVCLPASRQPAMPSGSTFTFV